MKSGGRIGDIFHRVGSQVDLRPQDFTTSRRLTEETIAPNLNPFTSFFSRNLLNNLLQGGMNVAIGGEGLAGTAKLFGKAWDYFGLGDGKSAASVADNFLTSAQQIVSPQHQPLSRSQPQGEVSRSSSSQGGSTAISSGGAQKTKKTEETKSPASTPKEIALAERKARGNLLQMEELIGQLKIAAGISGAHQKGLQEKYDQIQGFLNNVKPIVEKMQHLDPAVRDEVLQKLEALHAEATVLFDALPADPPAAPPPPEAEPPPPPAAESVAEPEAAPVAEAAAEQEPVQREEEDRPEPSSPEGEEMKARVTRAVRSFESSLTSFRQGLHADGVDPHAEIKAYEENLPAYLAEIEADTSISTEERAAKTAAIMTAWEVFKESVPVQSLLAIYDGEHDPNADHGTMGELKKALKAVGEAVIGTAEAVPPPKESSKPAKAAASPSEPARRPKTVKTRTGQVFFSPKK